MSETKQKHILYIVNVSSFFISHRLPLALEALKLGYRVSVASGELDSSGVLQSHGIKEYQFPLSRSGRNIRKEIKSCIELFKLCQKLSPDIIHNVTIKPVLYSSIINRLFMRYPLVNAVPGLGFSFIQQGFKAKLMQMALRRMYRFAMNQKKVETIFQNHDDMHYFLKRKITSPTNTNLIKGSGVCLETFAFTPEPQTDEVRILLPARMLKDKGVFEFITAAKMLAQTHPVKFLLAGHADDDNPSAISQAMLTEWSRLPYIEWLGHQEDMVTCYQNSHIVCLPSYREGMPKALLEAQAIGRPVVTTNVPGCREAIIDGETGFLVPVKEVKPLSEKLGLLIKDRALRLKMGQAARVLAEEEFSIEQVVKQTFDIYQGLLKSKTMATTSR